MRGVRGLTVVVVTEDGARFEAALTIACAQAAIGGRVRVYCHAGAVACLRPSPLIETARELGVALVACQTGLAECTLPLPYFAEAGGLVGILSDLSHDRLITI